MLLYPVLPKPASFSVEEVEVEHVIVVIHVVEIVHVIVVVRIVIIVVFVVGNRGLVIGARLSVVNWLAVGDRRIDHAVIIHAEVRDLAGVHINVHVVLGAAYIELDLVHFAAVIKISVGLGEVCVCRDDSISESPINVKLRGHLFAFLQKLPP